MHNDLEPYPYRNTRSLENIYKIKERKKNNFEPTRTHGSGIN